MISPLQYALIDLQYILLLLRSCQWPSDCLYSASGDPSPSLSPSLRLDTYVTLNEKIICSLTNADASQSQHSKCHAVHVAVKMVFSSSPSLIHPPHACRVWTCAILEFIIVVAPLVCTTMGLLTASQLVMSLAAAAAVLYASASVRSSGSGSIADGHGSGGVDRGSVRADEQRAHELLTMLLKKRR